MRYTRHARARMLAKGITEDMVLAVLAAPEWSPATGRGIRYDAMVQNRRLCVVIADEGDDPRVVTVFWFGER
jgi:Domain of unknown function (DUF4258)